MRDSASTDSKSPDSAVLREVSHDLGNRFHRFYYLAHELRRALPEGCDEVADGLQGLDDAVAEIEGLVRRTLAWLAPINLSAVQVSIGDLVASLRGRVAPRGLRVQSQPAEESEVAVASLDASVMVDPAKITELFATVLNWVAPGISDEVPAADLLIATRCYRLEDGGGLMAVFSIALPRLPERGEREGLSAALATKILQAHGGSLNFSQGTADGQHWVNLEFPCLNQAQEGEGI